MRNLYLTLTEIDNDFNGKEVKYYTKTIHTYSGLSVDFIPKGLKELEQMGIIEIVKNREGGRFKGKNIIFKGVLPPKTVTGLPVNGYYDPSEESTCLEESKRIKERKPQKSDPLSGKEFEEIRKLFGKNAVGIFLKSKVPLGFAIWAYKKKLPKDVKSAVPYVIALSKSEEVFAEWQRFTSKESKQEMQKIDLKNVLKGWEAEHES